MKEIILLSALAVAGLALLSAFFLAKSIPATAHAVEFSAAGVTEEGSGVYVPFLVSVRPGTGRVLVDIENAFYKQDAENSIRKARDVAARELGYNPGAFDVEFRAAGGDRAVGGESAGALFTAAIAAGFAGKKLRKDVAVSATVGESGALGEVQGVREKILSAAEAGVKYFIVAEEQEITDEASLAEKITVVRAKNAAEVIRAMLE